MSFVPQSLDALSVKVRAAFRQYLPGTDASVAQNTVYVIAKVLALIAREYELRLAWLSKQLFLTTATDENMIRLLCAEVGIAPKPAAAARGTVSGEGVPNTVYPSGLRFTGGRETFVTDAPFTADALGRFGVGVICEQAGKSGNRESGAQLTVTDPALWPGLVSPVIVDASGLTGGADPESLESLKARALARKRSTATAGSLGYYEAAALDVPGIAAAWAANYSDASGTVGVWVLSANGETGLAGAGEIAAVQEQIDALRLVRGRVVVVTPAAKPVDISIRLVPDTTDQRAAVIARLAAFFDARAQDSRIKPGLPGAPFTLPRAWLSEVVSTTPGEQSHGLVLPADDPVFQPGELPVLGSVTWV